MGTEQRADVRVGYQAQAVVAFAGKKHATRTIDLSRGGIKLLAPRELAFAENAQVEVQLTFSWTSEWVRIPAHVVYETKENGLRLWGLRFRNMPKDARILISLFINGQNPKAPERTSSARAQPRPRRPTPEPKSEFSFRSLIDDVVQYLHEEDAFTPKRKKYGR